MRGQHRMVHRARVPHGLSSSVVSPSDSISCTASATDANGSSVSSTSSSVSLGNSAPSISTVSFPQAVE